MIKQEWEVQESPRINKKQHRRLIRTPHQQLQQPQNPYTQLYSANPILPPGVHKEYHEAQMLKYRYSLDKAKLNKTTFPQVRTKNWLNQTQGFTSLNKNNINGLQSQLQKQQGEQHEFGQFRELMVNKIIVYSRINNKLLNRIDKQHQRYYCSIFINCRKDELKSKKTPIFEYLPRIYKQMRPVEYPQDIISFNSAFQSGNLFSVMKCPLQPLPTYELYMSNDTNTKGCTQWFYFSITAERRVKFRIKVMNFYKPTSLYMEGMKILVSNDQIQWKRIGTAIKYKRVGMSQVKQSYYLQFVYEIQQSHKQYYFSYGYPYTYTHLENMLSMVFQTPMYSKIASKSSICQSYLGNHIYMITISNNLKNKIQKPIIYVIARQHPGQTPGSFIVENFIKTILHNRIQMEQLRENFIFKIVPMINVDGVINGNYRSNFSGNDVNRQWLQPSRKLHPEIYNLKQEIIANKKWVHFFLDIHAHSRKQAIKIHRMNSFFYGSKAINFDNRLYPFVCSKLNKNVSFSQSNFTDDPTKKTTARVVLENQANIKKSLTFEASFYGYEDKNKKIKSHFKQQDLKGLGQSLALGLYYSEIGSVKYAQKSQNNETQKVKKQQMECARNSVSCHLGNQKKKDKTKQAYQKIQKNCEKIMQKWKKELQKFNCQNDAISEGSSIDPEHFQLNNFQQQCINHIKNQQILSVTSTEIFKPNAQQNKKIQTIVQREQQKNEVQIKKLRQNNLNNQQSEQEQKPEQTKMSFFPMQSNLRNSMIVKKLQTELQMQRNHKRYDSINDKKEKQRAEQKNGIFGNEIVRGQRFKSIDIETKDSNNYRNNIIQIKKALKYFMENKSYDYKSTDYDDYKNYLKYSTNGATLILSQKDSIARIKRKYARV